MSEHWSESTLGEVCDLVKRGVAPKYTDIGGVCVINQKCIRNHEINLEPARRHNIEAKSINPERYIRFGDVLVNSTGTGTLGRVAQVRKEPSEPTTVDTHVTIVRPTEGLFYPEFFGYMMIKIEDEITASGEGASGQTELPRAKLANEFQVTFPESLEEQKRIVAILDEAFAGIDTAIANTEKNLTNARELFESYLNTVFTKSGEEWTPKRLGDLTEVQSGGTPLKSKKGYWDGKIPWYSSGELNELYTKDSSNKITDLGLNNSNAKLFPEGSLLIGMYDTAALKMSILDRDAAFNQAIAGAKPNSDLDLIFIMYAINAAKPEILSQRRGVRQKNLSLGKIKDIVIPTPDIAEQQRIVGDLSALKDQTQRLENIYKQKLNSLNKLKQSLLQKAFSGDLTAENYKLQNEAVA